MVKFFCHLFININCPLTNKCRKTSKTVWTQTRLRKTRRLVWVHNVSLQADLSFFDAHSIL